MAQPDPAPESYLARLGFLFPADQGDDDSPLPTGPGAGEKPASWPVRLRRFTADHLKVLSALALAAVILTTWMVMQARSVALVEATGAPAWSTPAPVPVPETTPALWLIHVLGAVAHPGVVSVPDGARVIDAIEAAGGFTSNADPAELNLAAVLSDGCQIIVGTKAHPEGEVRQGLGGAGPAGSQSTGAKVNLNRAGQAELETLPGVGPVTAQAILAWRQEHGKFTAVTQLQEVSGIGPKTFAQIEPHVEV